MSEKCCCGCCSVYTATGVGLLWAVTESIFGIFINVWLLLLMSENGLFNPFRLCIDIETIEDFDVFHGIVLAGLGLNTFWLAFGILASVGNIIESHGRLTPWVFLTYIITLFDFGVSVYFAIKFQDTFYKTPEFYDHEGPTKTLTYLTLLVIYSGGGLMLIINFYLAHVVEMRGKEIDKNYSALLFYIMSHMSRCSRPNGDMEQNLLPEAPPTYDQVPSYLPPQVYMRTTESSGSSWSLSCEALKTMSTGQLDELNAAYNVNHCAEIISPTRNFIPPIVRSDGYQPLNIESNDCTALP